MKAYFPLTVAAVLRLVPAAQALINATWSMTGVPTEGVVDMTFPMNIDGTDHVAGYLFAQQVTFANVSQGLAYIGLEPRPDNNGETVLNAVFGSTVPRTTTTEPASCTFGVGGVACAVEFNGLYDRDYYLQFRNDNTTWIGTVTDSITGEEQQIGTFTLPATAGGIQGRGMGFVEWITEPAYADHCDTLPYQFSFFGNPITERFGSVGTQNEAWESGDCIGQVDFATRAVLGGYQNSCGFPGQTGA